MKLKIIILLVILISGCSSETKMLNKINLKTEDNLNIVANFYSADSEKAVILLHMLGRKKEDWSNFADSLVKEKYSVLALDFRGHGESNGNLREFTEKDFNNMALDVKEAKNFLASNGKTKIAIIGASIGANIALNYASQDKEIKTIVLLSPGLNYKGVKTEQTIEGYKNKILIVVSEDDNYSFESVNILISLEPDLEPLIYKNAGHGTNIFEKTDLEKRLKNWLKITL